MIIENQTEESYLNVYMRYPKTETLGPGHRYALWVQGCPFKCQGCMTPNSLDQNLGEIVPIQTIVNEILEQEEIEGITISGGEPFMQASALSNLIDQVKSIKNLGIIVYTGYTLEMIKKTINNQVNHPFDLLLKRIDLLIDGPYIEHLNDGLSLRGSSNQKVHMLSIRYQNQLSMYGQVGRKVEMIANRFQIDMIGIPTSNILTSIESMNRKRKNQNER
jgi:anaerobic ribonucleoside-triphosphate reductase activating protein